MLDIREIEYWISRYEQEANKLDHCVTWAALYFIRDKMLGTQHSEPQIAAYSQATGPIAISETLDRYGDSDFLRAVEGKDPADALGLMDSLMDSLRMTNPRIYESYLRRMRNL